ncbi:MAG: hypothetical protein ACJAZF_002827, partial [Granulosicoccus sp.]
SGGQASSADQVQGVRVEVFIEAIENALTKCSSKPLFGTEHE